MKYFGTVLMICIWSTIFGQVSNDECIFATHLGNVNDYCSGPTEFSNSEATLSLESIPFCFFGGASNDIWFTFTPTAPAVYIQITGAGPFHPSMAVYDGSCGNLTELACNSSGVNNIGELSVTQLVIGQIYTLRIDAEDGVVGDFQLCLKSFIPVPQPESDCKDAVVLCDKSPFQVDNLNNIGTVFNELTGPCVDLGAGQDAESASVWYVWTCKDSGTLTFTLEPNNPTSLDEDLDFVVYEMPGGLDDCDNRVGVRCMLSGRSGGNTPLQNEPCFGATGLADGETDVSETAGCSAGDNNFVAPLDMIAGMSYGLIINNFSESGFGFSIEFGGTGTFLGPEPDFFIEAVGVLECDKLVEFSNSSNSDTDPIINYLWNFGAGSTPQSSNGPGPHLTEFNSFGDKVAALTVESSRGCLVTKIIDFYVEPCCKDTSTLSVEGEGFGVDCFGDENGLILAEGFSGSPRYEYSIDGINYQPSPQFANLDAANYNLYVIDIKGCADTTIVIITEPNPIIVDAGPDATIDLGESILFDANADSDLPIVEINWSPLDSFLTCIDCFDPLVLPLCPAIYTLTVTDENGCTASDALEILVNVVRPLYWPNIFSPNDDNTNDFFNLYGGPAVVGIDQLRIYDRWGNLMYLDSPELNNNKDGWDGYFNGKPVNPGVYAWIAEVRFLGKSDNVLTYTGDVTVLR